MMTVFQRKYATAAGADVYLPMTKAGAVDFAVSADWTPVAGDVKVSKDGAAEANIATLPAYTNGAWKFVFSAAELTAKTVTVKIVDAAAKAVEDNQFAVETTQHASAMHPAEAELVRTDHDTAGSIGEGWNDARAQAANKKTANAATGATTVYKDDGTTVRLTQTVQAGSTDDEVDQVTT